MIINDIKIGMVFLYRAGIPYRITDVGTRTVCAINILDQDPVWTQGPPYLQDEVIFDEKALKSCFFSEDEDMSARLKSLESSYHPHFDSDYVMRMLNITIDSDIDRYRRKSLLRFDRVFKLNGINDVAHPVAPKFDSEKGWAVECYLLFSRKFVTIADVDLAKMPLSSEEDLKRLSNGKKSFDF